MAATLTSRTSAPPARLPVTRPAAGKARRRWVRLIVHVIVVAFMVVWFTPVLGLFVGSLRTQNDIAASGWWHALVAPLFTGYNYQQALQVIGLGQSLGTSLAIAVPTTVLTTLISAIGAFALTRMRFAGRSILSLALVALMVTPPQVTLVPLLKFFNVTKLYGTVPAMWLYMVGFTVPFGVFLVRGFVASIPEELFESARIDGASDLRIFASLVLPLSAPVLASLAIMQFLWAWNDLLTPLIFLGGTSVPQPLTVNVAGLVTATGQGEAQLMSATVISILIPLIVVISLQRYFVRGVLGGAVKG
ncbi:carbohydrate ABC transporter permease [Amycolatopsis saalfeldensis]|uniref:Alpha-glucoside transport system permease protein n=1 Tax=Amycolatopsis saalfeldensis TaxID=394193 RepID=A0A1H8XXL3_9PSEU|nr:carbohydrate ABC transporter permease [Amycolatopsis saalfeldensis]SEP44521.1 alpha-glucoside transport system permease protein [Amycolatopsis saalfeldensis]